MTTNVSFYSEEELKSLGLRSVGKNVKLSKKASLYRPDLITLDDFCRIDDFCVLSGEIRIGKYVHIACYSALFAGGAKIEMDDFSGLSSRCTLYAESDDYSGETMVNPTIPEDLRKPVREDIYIGRYAVTGATSVLLPGAGMGEGAVLASMSLLKSKADAWSIYGGVPARRIKERKKDILDLSRQLPADKK